MSNEVYRLDGVTGSVGDPLFVEPRIWKCVIGLVGVESVVPDEVTPLSPAEAKRLVKAVRLGLARRAKKPEAPRVLNAGRETEFVEGMFDTPRPAEAGPPGDPLEDPAGMRAVEGVVAYLKRGEGVQLRKVWNPSQSERLRQAYQMSADTQQEKASVTRKL